MIFNNLIINEKKFSQLNNYILSKNIPNGFLFYGNKGSGKFGHAIEFAAALLCKESKNLNACSKCNSCKKVKLNQHEGIHFILPLPKSNTINKNDSPLKAISQSELINIQKNINQKLINPYFNIQIDRAKTILINSIREIKKNINLSNFNNEWTIYIIIDSEKLCFPRQESANALLKILEEPKEKKLFLLMTSNINKMIDTVTSRCTKIFFPGINKKSMENYLIKFLEANHEKAKLISQISNGNMTLAEEILIDFDRDINNFIKLINLILNNDFYEWNIFFKNYLNNKNKIFLYLNLLESFFIDIITYQSTNDKNKIKLINCIDITNKFINIYQNTNWYKCIDIIKNTKNNIKNNAYLDLSIITLLIEINKVLINDNFLISQLDNYHIK